MTPCLFCGGDRSEPNHLARCDGRQGAIEAVLDVVEAFDPLIIAGAVDDTWQTSAAAALSAEDRKDTQRAEVYAVIKAAGLDGCTDDELQAALSLDGNSERPRRWELWQRNQITIRRDDTGAAIRRPTRTHRSAVVWVAVEYAEMPASK